MIRAPEHGSDASFGWRPPAGLVLRFLGFSSRRLLSFNEVYAFALVVFEFLARLSFPTLTPTEPTLYVLIS